MDLSSRERMLNALNCQPVDYAPCCFMQFTALESRCNDQLEMVQRQLEWGLDAMVQTPPCLMTVTGDTADLRGLPVHFNSEVQIKEWVEQRGGERYPTIFKEYITPVGALSIRVNKTLDWPYGNHIPFLDDFIIPRAQKPLITSPDDLKGLRYLLAPPTLDVIADFQTTSRPLIDFAVKHDLLRSGGLSAGADMAGWLCGLQNLIYLAIEEPDFVVELMHIIAAWNLDRMEIVLDEGVDLWVRRGWYENCDFWSPKLYRQFILPHLKKEVELAHSQRVKFGYIVTNNVLPLLDMIIEAKVDVLIGVDPVMGEADLKVVREKVHGRLCQWGGVNAPLTVEKGSEKEVRKAVKEALDVMAPGNGFILSPVDDIEDPSEHTWNNVRIFIQAWRNWYNGHGMM